MFPFLFGLGTGIYIGTIYDCKLSIKYIKKIITEVIPEDAIPKKKDDDDIN